MPIKEIMVFSAGVMASIMATHPLQPLEAVRKVQVQILRDIGRTDHWGNPRIVGPPIRNAGKIFQVKGRRSAKARIFHVLER